MKRFFAVLLGALIIGIIAFLSWPEARYTPYEVSAEYRAQVDEFNLPPVPTDWQWSSYAGDDGIRMRWGQTGNSGAAKATVVMVPGYTATLDMYGEHMGHLASRGYHVVGFDLRGQGGSERPRLGQPEKLLIDDFARYSDELAGFLRTLELPEDRPLIVMGMSFGGHVAFRMAGDHPGVADGLLLLAPALQPKAGDMSYEDAKRIINIGRKLGKDSRYMPGNDNWVPASENNLRRAGIEYCASNPDRLPNRDVVFTRIPEQRVGGVTFQWAGEFYESNEIVRAAGYPESIDIPVTMIHAEVDDFVVTDVNREICDRRMGNCMSAPIEGTGHCLLQESDSILDQIYDALDGLSARIAP